MLSIIAAIKEIKQPDEKPAGRKGPHGWESLPFTHHMQASFLRGWSPGGGQVRKLESQETSLRFFVWESMNHMLFHKVASACHEVRDMQVLYALRVLCKYRMYLCSRGRRRFQNTAVRFTMTYISVYFFFPKRFFKFVIFFSGMGIEHKRSKYY